MCCATNVTSQNTLPQCSDLRQLRCISLDNLSSQIIGLRKLLITKHFLEAPSTLICLLKAGQDTLMGNTDTLLIVCCISGCNWSEVASVPLWLLGLILWLVDVVSAGLALFWHIVVSTVHASWTYCCVPSLSIPGQFAMPAHMIFSLLTIALLQKLSHMYYSNWNDVSLTVLHLQSCITGWNKE